MKNILIAITILLVVLMPQDVLAASKFEQAIFAGGCFWCMEADFEKIPGVLDVVSGYAGGSGDNPNYKNYSAKGHIEVVRIVYDPAVITYSGLLDLFWHKVDPTDDGGQFCDRGHSYTTAIFYQNENQKINAERSKANLIAARQLESTVVTPILSATAFYPAEDYHQDYYRKNPVRYKFYRFNCGRDKRLKKLWGHHISQNVKEPNMSAYKKPDQKELKTRLDPLQYKVTQENGTEPPFKNAYWDNKQEGIYVDVVSGEPLFSSRDKYKSGTGWPSFTKPLVAENVVNKEDRSWFAVRTEVRSKHADSHLGHVFDDGPQPTGLRYCLNSAALRFIPKENLAKEGYEDYIRFFDNRQ